MPYTPLSKNHIKFILILILFWTIGILFALFFGLGWFFLIETLRRVLTYIPPLGRWFRKLILGEEELLSQMKPTASQYELFSRVLGFMITLGWAMITIFVFTKINIPLLDIFTSISDH